MLTGTTNYTLHGKNIVHMTQGGNTLHFFYDANNKPAIVEYNGTKYAYVHNLQGDIVAILDSTGTTVVQYKYDAWGKPISKTGSMAGTLGTVQPFRYRGYVYDEETGLYYLQSRYYRPEFVRFLNADVYVATGQGLLDSNMSAYCRNKPVFQHDAAGTSGALVHTSEADLDPTDDHENYGRCPGSGGPSSFAGHQAVPGTSISTNYTHFSGPYNTNQAALVDLAKCAKQYGAVTLSDAKIFMQWCQEYNVRFHLDFGHPSRGGYIDRIWHVHIGPVNHLPISPTIRID